jgi:hypothetical protein
MKSLLKLSIPAIALALCFTHSAFAQVDGYRFGVGLGYAGGYNRCDRNFFGLPIAPTPRIDQPPFFALYPPVYYSQDIIARPYGVSPYLLRRGIYPGSRNGRAIPCTKSILIMLTKRDPPAEPQGRKRSNRRKVTKTTWIRSIL